LSVGITGGTTPYNVKWLDQASNVVGTTTTSSTTASINLSPTASNSYSASVTDSSNPPVTNSSSGPATVSVVTLPPSNNHFTGDVISKYHGRT